MIDAAIRKRSVFLTMQQTFRLPQATQQLFEQSKMRNIHYEPNLNGWYIERNTPSHTLALLLGFQFVTSTTSTYSINLKVYH